ncbi:reverse transcriptase domain-containing protein, partial [Tanacetum coccineum]
AHPVAVLTDQPIWYILSKIEKSGRLAKWVVELGEHTITYQPRTSVKGQILSDFLAELPTKESDGDEKVVTNGVPAKEVWRLFTDGSSNEGGSGAGLILTNPAEVEFTYALRFKFKASNNEAEYEALLAGLRIAEKIGVKHIEAFVDSKLVANQINDLYHAIEETMQKYLSKAKELIAHFETFSIMQVPRSQNKQADALSKMASVSFAHLTKKVLVEERYQKKMRKGIHDDLKKQGQIMVPCSLLEGTSIQKVHALWPQISGNKGNATRVLLANHAYGRPNGDQSVQRMSSAQSGATFAKDKAEDYHITLGIP